MSKVARRYRHLRVDRILKLAARVLREPEHYAQEAYARKLKEMWRSEPRRTLERTNRTSQSTLCGTVCCFVGFGLALKDTATLRIVLRSKGDLNTRMSRKSEEVGDWLGLQYAHTLYANPGDITPLRDIFGSEYTWPAKIQRQYDRARTPAGKARAGYRFLKWYIDQQTKLEAKAAKKENRQPRW